MTEIQYIGEFLLPRQIGHFAIVGAFVAALLATLAYFFATQDQIRRQKLLEEHQGAVLIESVTEGDRWQRLGRGAFLAHALLLIVAIGCIFYVMIAKRYEYFYAHSHTNNELEFRYIFAAFWEGQEGSFLLWLFFHVLLGGWLILKGGDWERPTLAIIAVVQVFLGSMILGIHLGFGENVIKWGSNPILLMREMQGDIPLFRQVDYVAKLANSARGLNPLLQNYWMTIHPPTLFLGFASTTIPFAFAIAGLWTRRYEAWLRPALPYVLFSGAVLGTGILMGGAWAYEALSFNGYWAWDPVENMSLVPWLTLIAGLHTHLVARATGQSIRATVVFYILTFLLIVYSTFLTRSGILGDTSAHAFTEMGLTSQLVIFQAFFIALSGYFLVKHYRKIPVPAKDEAATSREFWMFMGSLVLLMSVILISFTTSIPVYNKVFELFGIKSKLASPIDVVAHHNQFQLWIGVFIGVLSGFAQYLRFKEFNFANHKRTVIKHLLIALFTTATITGLLLVWIEARAWQYILLLFAGVFTVITNLDYIIFFLRRDLKAAGSAFSHVGFGVMIVGILASGLNKLWISHNEFVMRDLGFRGEQLEKNVLVLKGKTMKMAGFEVNYLSDTAYNNRRDFNIVMKKLDKNGDAIDSFSVKPYILYDNKTGKIASTNPDTKHYLTYDVFSHIAALPPEDQDPAEAKKLEDTLKYQNYDLAAGETVTLGHGYRVTFESINREPRHPKYVPKAGDVAVSLRLRLERGDTVCYGEPLLLLREGMVYQLPVTVNDVALRIKLGFDLFDKLLNQKLNFKEFKIKEKGTFTFEGNKVTIENINPSPDVKNFDKRPDDLAFGLQLGVVTEGGQRYAAEPVFLIRGNQPMPLKDEIADLGLHFVVSRVNPESGEFTIQAAKGSAENVKLPISIAENMPVSDYIVLEATVNPGINLVWVGSITMLLGLVIALWYKLSKKLV